MPAVGDATSENRLLLQEVDSYAESMDGGSSVRAAVDVVMSDVEAVLGPDAVRVVILSEVGALDQLARENPSLLDAATDPCAGEAYFDGTDFWVYVPGVGSATGSRVPDGEPFAATVERIADRAQQAIVESRAHFGTSFPSCHRHGSHPMWPEVRDERAVWVCPSDPDIAVPIGQLGGGSDPQPEEP